MLFHAKYFPYFSAILVCVGMRSIVEKKEEFSLPYGQHSPKHQNRKTSGARRCGFLILKFRPTLFCPPHHVDCAVRPPPFQLRTYTIRSESDRAVRTDTFFSSSSFLPVRPSLGGSWSWGSKGGAAFYSQTKEGTLDFPPLFRPSVRPFLYTMCLAPIPSKRSTRGGGIRTVERTPDRNPLRFRRQSPS